jgi:hypothetical protein
MQNIDESNDDPAAAGDGYCCSGGAWWQLPLLLAVVLVAILLVNRWRIREPVPTTGGPPTAAAAEAENGQTIVLTIDFGGGMRREWSALPWREGMTVGDALSAASQPSGGELEFAQQGSGASAFLTRFGDAVNEGAGGRNWTYEVNGQRADRSFAVYVLKPGDQVLWKFDRPK